MKTKISHILFVAFLLRLTFLVVNNYIMYLPHGNGDALVFEHKAYLLSISNYNIDYLEYLTRGSYFFTLLCSFVYTIFGRQPFVLGLCIVVLGVWCVKLVHKASLLLFKDVIVAKKAAWIAALFPQFCLNSALIFREIPINFFLLLTIIAFIKYWKYSNKTSLIFFIIYGLFATILHSGMFFIFFGLIIFNLFKKKSDRRVKVSFAKKYVLPVIIVFAIVIIASNGIGLFKFGGSVAGVADQFTQMQNRKTEGNSAYPQWMLLNGGFSDMWKVPLRFTAFLFAPVFPFIVKSAGHLLGLFDAFIYLFFFYRMFKNRHFLKSNTTASAILIISLTLSLVFSMGVSNVGTGIRHRAKIAPLFILLFIPIQRKVMKSITYHF